jgi:uncharacterized protein YyaL (SSP411 family)
LASSIVAKATDRRRHRILARDINSRVPNLLAHEKSPYLLQHAQNPVDWMPWGEAAFARARAEDKPLLVSIGYSSCHWCHVMEEESFADAEVASLMNRELVCVKVDREERPDVDRVYMAAVTAMAGQGGWPLNCFLTPEGRPFFGGTYFPARRAYGRPSWRELVAAAGRSWRDPDERRELCGRADRLSEQLSDRRLRGDSGPLDALSSIDRATASPFLEAAREALLAAYDPAHGGFSGAPKFPMPSIQHLLFRLGRRLTRAGRAEEGQETIGLALHTLRQMARGGIHDLLGGGFCRYSTDERWHVPHFEKMLTDNAQLLLNFAEAFQLSGEAAFANTAVGIAGYLLRDLRGPEGAFYCAEDADSLPAAGAARKREGAFYTWAHGELHDVLGADAEELCATFGALPDGNVRGDQPGELAGLNVLYDASSARAPDAPGSPRLLEARRALFEVRARRPRPQRDEKILAGWNGLAIAALARASWILGEPSWLSAAKEAAAFVLEALTDPQTGLLHRRWAGGERAVPAQADDLAMLAWGLLELHQATLDGSWLSRCMGLVEMARARFPGDLAEPGSGAAAARDPLLPFELRESQDGALPAPMSLFCELQLRLWSLGGGQALRDSAERILRREQALLLGAPLALPHLVAALVRASGDADVVTLRGDQATPAAAPLLRLLRRSFRPELDWRAEPGQSGEAPTAMLCRGLACQRPTSSPAELEAALGDP